MGLDISHDAWCGGYMGFMAWRTKIASVVGIPLPIMEGFYEPKAGVVEPIIGRDFMQLNLWKVEQSLPIKWASLRPDALHILLHHSDCEGEIGVEHLKALADRMEEILPLMPDGDGPGHVRNWRETTAKFIAGCRAALAAGEPLEFG